MTSSLALKFLCLMAGMLVYLPAFAGSAAAPNYTFSGNTNTGMFNPMANIVGFSTAGTERLRVDASGNVGIGTTLPGAMLEVAGQVKITGGTPGAGKVLTSDAAGLATWTAPSTGSVTSVATGTGLSGGPITTTGTISLANTTVAAGSFGTSTSIPTFNVDAQGRLTGVTAQAIPNATTTVSGLLTFGDWNIFNGKVNKAGDTMTGLLVLSADPSATLGAATKQYVDAAITTAGANYIRKDGTVAFTAAQSMGSFKINFVADPISAQDAATKNYADTKILSKAAAIPAVGQNGQSLRWNDGNASWEYFTATAALGYTPVNIIGDTMTGALIHPAGTAAAPSVGIGSTSMGIFSPGSNILGFSTAGTERMRITDIGRVGFGTNSPQSLFHVNAGTDRLIVESTNAGMISPLNLYNSNSGASAGSGMVFTAGTISSFVGGIASQRTDASANARTSIRVLSNSAITATDNTAALYVEGLTAGTRTVINGNVGIGLTTPTAVLNLKAGTVTANTAPLKFTSGPVLTTPEDGAVEYDGTNLFFTDSTAARRTIATATTLGSYLPLAGGTMTGAVVSSAGTAAAPSVGVGATTLGLFNGGTNILGLSTAGTERMRIDASGNVGIGTLTPTATLAVNGVIATALGSIAAPSITFIGDLDTGMFSGGANSINFTAGGVHTLQLGSSVTTSYARLRLQDGSVALPGYSFFNDTNSGLFSGGADILGVSTGGVERMRIDASGNVGIGTTAPGAGLDIATTGTSGSAVIVPRDTTANRPSVPVNGMIRYNTTTNRYEGYENSSWVFVTNPVLAKVDLVGQTAAILTTTLFTFPADGTYEMLGIYELTALGTAGTIQPVISFTSPSGNAVTIPYTNSSVTAGVYSSMRTNVAGKAGTTLTYSVNFTGVTGTPAYRLTWRLRSID